MFSGSRANSGLVILFLVTVGENQSVTCLPGQGGKGQSPTLKHEQEEKSPGGNTNCCSYHLLHVICVSHANA